MTLRQLEKSIPAIRRQLNSGEKKIVIIDGPAGKTTAMHALQDAGIPAYEEYQALYITVGPSSP